MKRLQARRRAFTLIEVLAALGLIIVLTLTLVITIRAQLKQAEAKQLAATVATVNTQIAVAYDQPGVLLTNFTSVAALVKNGIITAEQRDQLTAARYEATTQPPAFSVSP
ncbi:type II secretion system protein [Lacticaseibacillus daqingensis]|uniref:type II secretion system protein n=1 Tax=Lacticaseibacillus daqingensis TaxID=2486014 RepID=UPI000F794292|nr:type II secretion system protein [Lacticaseibacillus daqingensis]